jgi:hypothetical protein
MRLILVSAFLVFAFSSYLYGQATLPFTGRAFSDIYYPLEKGSERPSNDKALNQLSASLWLQFDHQIKESLSGRAVLEATAFDFNNSVVHGRGDSTHIESDLREGYLSYQEEGFELRAGKMITPWGKSDAINPTDFLTAKNYTFFNPDTETQRLGGAGVLISWTPTEYPAWNLIAVVNPYFPEGKFLIAPNVLPAGVNLRGSERPDIGKAENFEEALKGSYSGESWDASLSLFRGWNHFPQLSEVSHTLIAPGVVAVDLKQVFKRQQAVGADASYSHEKWIYRLESAYFWTENDSNMLYVPSHHDTVVGAERSLGDHFRYQVQYVLRVYAGYTPLDQVTGGDPVAAAVNRQIARSNAQLFQYLDQTNQSATFRLGYTNEETGWDGELFLMESFAGQDFLVRPKASYAVTDHLKYTFGADIYGGPGHRPLGALNPYNSVFFEAKYSF